jgi:hypothetical protein
MGLWFTGHAKKDTVLCMFSYDVISPDDYIPTESKGRWWFLETSDDIDQMYLLRIDKASNPLGILFLLFFVCICI